MLRQEANAPGTSTPLGESTHKSNPSLKSEFYPKPLTESLSHCKLPIQPPAGNIILYTMNPIKSVAAARAVVPNLLQCRGPPWCLDFPHGLLASYSFTIAFQNYFLCVYV